MEPAATGPHVIFHPFTRLPKELRSQIWKLASVPRTLTIKKHFSRDDENSQYLFTVEGIPAVMHVCQESRFEAPYTPAFSLGSGQRYIWVNFKSDTIMMPDYVLRHVKAEERAQIRRAIFEVDSIANFMYFDWEDMSDMRGLEDLEIISAGNLLVWVTEFEKLRMGFKSWFGEQEGWVFPKIRVIERRTGEELNSTNFLKISEFLKGRGRGQALPSSADEQERAYRREMERSQRQRNR
jgi:hypothetical protein